MKPIGWGILAPGNIAHAFATALAQVQGAKLVAVASRNGRRAQDFAQQYGFESSYGSYEELVSDPQVDIVYVASPHSHHYAHSLMALQGGKAVICEKPICVNGAQLEHLRQVATDKGLLLMEAMWTAHMPLQLELVRMVQAGELGEIKRIEADLSFAGDYDPSSRLYNPDLAGGSLLDVGVYPLSFAQRLMGSLPGPWESQWVAAPTGVDANGSLLFQWESGTRAVLNFGFDTQGPATARVMGTLGVATLPNPFHCCQSMTLGGEGGERVLEFPFPFNGYEYQIVEAQRCLDEGRTDASHYGLDQVHSVLTTMDAIRHRWGLRYQWD